LILPVVVASGDAAVWTLLQGAIQLPGLQLQGSVATYDPRDVTILGFDEHQRVLRFDERQRNIEFNDHQRVTGFRSLP
jgi:hypothetical protein